MAIQAVARIYDTAGVIETLKKEKGRVPKLSGPMELSQARFGNEALVDMLLDPWGTPFHIESSPEQGYLIVAAGADRKFDRSSWSKPAATRSAADDIVFRNGSLVRSPVEWVRTQAGNTSADEAARLERALALSRHSRTTGELRSMATAMLAYLMDKGKMPAAASAEALARHLEPTYIGTFPRTAVCRAFSRYSVPHIGMRTTANAATFAESPARASAAPTVRPSTPKPAPAGSFRTSPGSRGRPGSREPSRSSPRCRA